MDKTELINAIATEAGLSKADAKKTVEASFSGIEKALANGDKVFIVGLGVWSVAEKEARDARNPRTGEVTKVPAKKVVKFKAETELTDAVNR